MSFLFTSDVSFGISHAGLTDVRAQPMTAALVATGSPLTATITEGWQGQYAFEGLVPDDTRFVKFYSAAAPTTITDLRSIRTVDVRQVGGTSANLSTPQTIALGTDNKMLVSADTHTSGLTIAGYTGNTKQTGNVGVNGAGLTALGDTRLANLDAAVSSRLAPTVAGRTLDVNTTGGAGIDLGNVDNQGATLNLNATTIAIVSTATVDSFSGPGLAALQTAFVDAMPAALLDRVAGVETGMTVRQAMRVMAAVLAGKSTNDGQKFRNIADTKDRVSATVDSNGNRTAIVLDLS